MKKDKQTRYVITKGLAFVEEEDMNKLSALSEKGWFLDHFSLFGYVIRRGEPHKQIYCLDIRELPKEEEAEYHNIFADSGWTYVCSAGDFHIFSAEPGTVPIHTDRATIYDKYTKVARISKTSAFITLLLTLGSIALRSLSTKVWNSSLLEYSSLVVLVLCVMAFVPSTMVYIAYSLRLRKFSS
ncbi:DUF2812 domain-containing protein [Paenibacillus sp. FSL H7-0357]|uniref:DUF2812 domain-containing protein n=1 Tax=unclassified Paenibacillus TaxID=185978 RepID=UPI00068D5C5C|nr:DUF2812 domain-containing protein [Paenibacillus sp. FSL H7-0357]